MSTCEKLTDAIPNLLSSPYRLEDGSEIRGQSISFVHQELCECGWKNLGGFRAWPVSATGGRHNATEAGPFWVYKTPITEPEVIFSFIEREG